MAWSWTSTESICTCVKLNTSLLSSLPNTSVHSICAVQQFKTTFRFQYFPFLLKLKHKKLTATFEAVSKPMHPTHVSLWSRTNFNVDGISLSRLTIGAASEEPRSWPVIAHNKLPTVHTEASSTLPAPRSSNACCRCACTEMGQPGSWSVGG